MTTPEPPDETPERPTMVAAGGWCAPSEALYNMSLLPEIGIRRGADWANTPYVAPPPLTRRQRFVKGWRKLRERTRAVRYAACKAWKFPDGWWEVD